MQKLIVACLQLAILKLESLKRYTRSNRWRGFKPFAIFKKLCVSRQTATKYYSIDTLLERRSKLRNGYHVFDRYVEEEVGKGKFLSAVYAEIKKQGFIKGVKLDMLP